MTSPEPPEPANFNRVARCYRWMEYLSFGWSLTHCRNYFLSQLSACRHAVAFGDGDGRFLSQLLKSNPDLQADAVDTSAAMLHLLQRRCSAGKRPRLRTHNLSALQYTPARSTDLIVTHFFLDCLTQRELDILATQVAGHVRPQSLWLVSDFRIPETGLMRFPARALIRALYLGFRLLTGLRTTALPNHAAALTAASFARIAHHHSLAGLLTTELWQLDPNPMPSQEYTSPMLPPQRHSSHSIADPVPDPEPASPSLPGPDPGVFHPDPCDLPPAEPESLPPAE